VEKSGISPGS